jgi:hypothetical protein
VPDPLDDGQVAMCLVAHVLARASCAGSGGGRGCKDACGNLAKRFDLTSQSVTNFIFHCTMFARSQNHASDQLYFLGIHNANDHKARVKACLGVRRSDQLYFTCTVVL